MSYVLSVGGVEKIVMYSEPILKAVYPIAFVLILLNTIQGPLNQPTIYYGATLGALLPTFDTLANIILGHPLFFKVFQGISERWQSFYWIFPSVLLAGIFYAATKIYRTFFQHPALAHEGANGK